MTQDDGSLAVGDTVRFMDMPDPSLNGGLGELVKPVGKDRWVVAPSGESEKTKVVSRKNLQKVEQKQPKAQDLSKFAPQPCVYSIVGTWDDWEMHEMRWNGEALRFEYLVTVGKDGQESFKLLKEGDWDYCLHPDKHDASPHDGHALLGPDDGGLDENWTIGHHATDAAEPGKCYQVRLMMTPDGKPKAVTWAADESTPAKLPAKEEAVRYAPKAAAVEPRVMAEAPTSQYGAMRPEVAWRPPPSAEEASNTEAADRIEQEERQARKRLVRRLEEAAEAERLPIQDGKVRTTRGAQASDWESLLRLRRMKDAKSRYDETFREAGDEEPEQPREEEEAPAEPAAPQGDQKSCVDCGADTPYLRCSACLLLRVHKKSWKPGAPEKKGAPLGAPVQPFVPKDPRDAFDHFWTF